MIGVEDRGSGIKAKVVAYTPFREGVNGVLSMELTYPRSIHAEFMTHRNMSRNAASSRAVPFNASVQAVLDNTFYPLCYWGKDGPGMQAGIAAAASFEEGDAIVREARDFIIQKCRELAAIGVHKSILNRLLEPFSYITVIATTTLRWWQDMVWLRNHKAAERHFQLLAIRVHNAIGGLQLDRRVGIGGGHFPYIERNSDIRVPGDSISKALVSSARCARISYKVSPSGVPFKWADDLNLGSRLITPTEPLEDWRWHASPLEHVVFNIERKPKGISTAYLEKVKADTTSIYGDLPFVTYRQLAEYKLIQQGILKAPDKVVYALNDVPDAVDGDEDIYTPHLASQEQRSVIDEAEFFNAYVQDFKIPQHDII